MLSKCVVVFDLDDTLYYEIDYLKSAYKEISKEISKQAILPLKEEILFEEMMEEYVGKRDVFSVILKKYKIKDLTKDDLIRKYRNHKPKITLSENRLEILRFLKENNVKIGIITDGRSITQRHKIQTLKLDDFIEDPEDIVISEEIGYEKPSKENYLFFENKYKNENTKFFYIGDNTKKDFITPNKFGWRTICLIDEGFNIHKQDFGLKKEYLPHYKVKNIIEIKHLIFDF